MNDLFITDRRTTTVRKHDIAMLFSDASFTEKQAMLQSLEPQLAPGLAPIFARFLENEHRLDPLPTVDLLRLFDTCSDPAASVDTLFSTLHQLSPGNGRIGSRQVNMLADHLRKRVVDFMRSHDFPFEQLVAHDHVFGSGGDFFKTIHASTIASIVVAPLLKVCKTGTTNVTSFHGSAQAMTQMGYQTGDLSIKRINMELLEYGFAFIPLAALGFPYSPGLKAARERLWWEAKRLFSEKYATVSWQEAIRSTPIPLDIFKIVSPNAQVLYPRHHTTGVCAPAMIPYVLSLYFHLQSQGMIVYNYDSVDEVVNASSDPTPNAANNLLIQVEAETVSFAECSPEDLGFARAQLADIREEEDLTTTNNDFWNVISGRDRGPKRDFVVVNAAVLLVAAGRIPATDSGLIGQLRAGIGIIEELIDSHRSEENFQRLLAAYTAM